MKTARNIFCAVLAACCLASRGHAGDDDFFEVAQGLDAGGEYFEIARAERLQQKISAFLRRAMTSVSREGNGIPDAPPGKQVHMLTEYFAAAAKRAGLRDIALTGKSAVAIDDSPWFIIRSVLRLKPETSGWLWRIPGGKNRPIVQSMAEMPLSSVFAGALDLNMEPLAEEPAVKYVLSDKCGLDDAAILRLLRGASGRWFFSILDNGNTILQIPDSEKMLFSLLKPRLLAAGFTDDGNRLYIQAGNKGLDFIHLKKCLSCSLYDTGEYTPDDQTLGDSPVFQAFADALPSDGVACFFLNGSKEVEDTLTIGGFPVRLCETIPCHFSVVERVENGFRSTGVSTMSPQEEAWLCDLFLLGKILSSFDDQVASRLFGEPDDDGGSAPPQHEICRQHLEEIYRALTAYRAKHGAFPAGLHSDGWQALLSESLLSRKTLVCPDYEADALTTDPETAPVRYVYFGDWGKFSDGKMPLAADLPDNHECSFNVLYSDGTIATLEQENLTAVRKEISVLHTINRYDEQRFAELMRRASELDNILEME
ncbi:MAG: hypothetical protein MJ016_04845 [Victivallaceae bacterium]|nr:hypothetical protein [Victivallaceae bacterium]